MSCYGCNGQHLGSSSWLVASRIRQQASGHASGNEVNHNPSTLSSRHNGMICRDRVIYFNALPDLTHM